MFLVADTRLYKPLFGPSVRRSVRRSQSCFSRFSAPAHPSATNAAVYTALFSCKDTQLYKRHCPSVHQSICHFIHKHELKSGETCVLEAFLVCVSMWEGRGVGVGRPCPPARNNIVTPRHMLYVQVCLLIDTSTLGCCLVYWSVQCVNISVSLSILLSLSVCLFYYLSVPPYVNPAIFPSIHMSVCPSIFQSIHLS